MRPVDLVQDSSPEALLVEPDGIPAELKRRPQWVNWRYALDGEKWTKHPYDPQTGRKASSTDLLTWSAFKKTLEAYESGEYDGIGFVFCSADPYCGVDLDGCVNRETGEIELWASQIIDGLDSYAELSPSGKGVHIVARGKLPVGGGRRGPVEMYCQDRFFTMTGHALGGVR